MSLRRIPSLNWLRVFEAAARFESFARAAGELNMSAAAVSQQIKALEGHLGRALFERHARFVTLTDSGRAFLPVVRQSLGSVETTAAALFGSRDSAPLLVQSSLIFACGWLASRLGRFREFNPAIQLSLTTGNAPAEFLRTQADWQILFGGPWDMPEDAEFLMGERLSVVALSETAVQLESADCCFDFPLIEVSTHRMGWLQLLAGSGERDLTHANITFVDNTVLALDMAASGGGLAIARGPASHALVERTGLVTCAVVPQASSGQGYFLVSGTSASQTPAAQAFREWLITESAEARTHTPLSPTGQSG